jgi:hypothetical protein
MTSQVFHHYRSWEDWKHGMWSEPRDPATEASHAADILSDPTLFGEAAREMLAEWPNAAQQNLTNPRSAGRSWVGQATCCWLADLSESATRSAWWLLSAEERDAANQVADEAVAEWRRTRQIQTAGGHHA